MKTKILLFLALAILLSALALVAAPTPAVLADSTIVVTPGATQGWFFYDDDFPGGQGGFVTGPATPPLGTGSAHYYLPPGSSARQALTTLAYAGTRLSQITNLQYSTYRSQLASGNESIYLQFDVDYDATDANFAYQGRLVFLPFTAASVPQNTWQTWNPMTAGKWYSSRAPFNTLCPQTPGCTWAQILTNWPNAGIMANTGWLHLKAGGPADGFDGNMDAFTIGVNGTNTTYDFEGGSTALVFVPDSAKVGVGNSTVIGINLNNAVDVYGFQFQVTYDDTKASAAGVWADNATPQFRFFRTNFPASIPNGWDASCVSGICKFAVSHVAPQTAVTGSGPLAFISLTGVSPGTFTMTFSSDLVSDIDGSPISHTTNTAQITVYGYATVSGAVTLQGRSTPINTGTVTLTDLGGNFPPMTTTFSAADGTYSFSNVPAMPTGSNYQFDADHSLYLGNRQTHTLNPGDSYTAPTTKLLGGDADDSDLIDLSDLTIVGGQFGNSGAGITDARANINADNDVNIFDLVLPGGNFNLTTPHAW